MDKLLEQISVSGCEECGQEVVKSHMQPFSDEIWTDEMGDVICILNPESPVRVMLSAHADEIGLLVTRITEEGRIQAIERGVSFIRIIRDRKFGFIRKRGLCMVL